MRGRGTICQVLPPPPTRLPRVKAEHTRRRSLSWGDSAAPELAACVRCAALGTAGVCPIEWRCIGGELSRSVRNRSATCQLPLSTPSKSTRVGTLPFGRRRSTRACCARTPYRAGCGGRRPYRRGRTGEKPLSFGARPWCGVPASASNAKSAAACETTARAPALAVSREEAQHSRLLRARVAPRWS